MIRLENVSLRYQQGEDVLRHINLDIPQGRFDFSPARLEPAKPRF